MEQVIHINKPIGKTPLEIVRYVKSLYPSLKHTKIGYAGRLDPMAEGVLLLLIGDTNKEKHVYERFDKTYVCKAVLGIQTDSYDLLGIVNGTYTQLQHTDLKEKIYTFFKMHTGNIIQEHPPYSSARVKGKPLFYWAREGKMDTITIPTKKVEIYSVNHIEFSSISSKELFTLIQSRIQLVKGNFRQDIILKAWEEFFNRYPYIEFEVVESIINCSSGTYIRSLVHNMGKYLGTGATLLSLKRTSVGNYCLKSALSVST